MDDEILLALNQDKVIDITTRGRKTGLDRRIEIWFHTIDGQVIITGSTGRRWGRRDWLANLLAHPSFTFHLKQSVQADLSARATPVTDKARRRKLFTKLDSLVKSPCRSN